MTDWSTYALVELDSVTIQWVRQGTVPGARLKKKTGDITFIPIFVLIYIKPALKLCYHQWLCDTT
jgi:hypothetical protein